MAEYSYYTSEKSILDRRCDRSWDRWVKWLATNYRWLTPNMLTVSGFIPFVFCFILFINGMIGDIFFLLGSLSIVWHLNIDALDGKLARETKNSSPFGQILDHGSDATLYGLVAISLVSMIRMCDVEPPGTVYIFSLTVANIVSFMASLEEYYTGTMITSIGKIGTTELEYTLSLVMLMFYFIRSTVLYWMLITVLSVGMIGIIVYGYKILTEPKGNRIDDNQDIMNLDIKENAPYILSILMCWIIYIFADSSMYQLVVMNMYLCSLIVDVIFSRCLKERYLMYDHNIVVLHALKMMALLIINSNISLIFDLILWIEMYTDKSYKYGLITRSKKSI